MKFLLFSTLLVLIKCTEVVNLNVGGKIFTTLRSTLEKTGPDTYLYNLFNSEMSKKTTDNDGYIFLDHDPDTFGLLLNLLRGYDVLKGKTTDEMTMLYQDADFFGMADLMKRIEDLPDEYVNTENYRGGMKRKEKHGHGFGIEKTDDSLYKGDFLNGIKHGYGYEKNIGDDSYEGEFVDGKWHGHGILSTSKGTYKGEFKDGKREGHGENILLNGHKFVGEFKNDELFKGRYEWPSGSIYEGEYKNRLKHGHGKYWYADGRYFEGEHLNGKANGYGRLQEHDHTYEGEFRNGFYHGRGKKIYKNGRVEEGDWENNHFRGA